MRSFGYLIPALMAIPNVLGSQYTIVTSLVKGGFTYTGNMNGYEGADTYCESKNGGNESGYTALLNGNPSLDGSHDTVHEFFDYAGKKVLTASFNEIFGKNPPDTTGVIADRNGFYDRRIYVWTGVHGNECRDRDGNPWSSESQRELGGQGDAVVFDEWIDDGSEYCNVRHLLYCIKRRPTVRGDPHFVGFDGCKFDFDGEDGSVFAIYSDKGLQINALFQRLAADTTDGNWMTKLGIRTADNSFILDPAIGLMHAENGSVLTSPGTVKFGADLITLTFNGYLVNSMTITTSVMVIKAEVKRFRPDRDDFFINIDFELKARPVTPHGVLGQTARPIVLEHSNSAAVRNCAGVEGKMEDYIVKDGILGNDFTFTQFGNNAPSNTLHRERREFVPVGSRAMME